MKKLFFSLTISLGLILSACSSPTPAATEAPAPTDTAVPPTATLVPTETPTELPTDTPEPTETPTITPTPTPAVVAISVDNAASLTQLHTWTDANARVSALDVSPDGTTVAFGGTNSSLFFANVETGELIREQDQVFASNLEYSHDGSLIAVSGGWPSFGGVYIVDAVTGDIVYQVPSPVERGESQSITFAPDDESVLIGWQLGEGGPLVERYDFVNNQRVPLNTTRLYAQYAPDGQTFISMNGLYQKKDIFFHDAESGQVIRELLPPDFNKRWYFQRAIFTPDGSQLYVSSGLYQSLIAVELLDIETGEVIREYGEQSEFLLALSPDGQVLATSHEPNQVHLWNAATGELLATLEGHTNIITIGVFSADGSKFITGSDDGSVIVWGVE